MVRAIHAMERRLQDLERKFQNKERLGKIVQVKYEKDRWYVKMNDGDDQTPSALDVLKQDIQERLDALGAHSHATIAIFRRRRKSASTLCCGRSVAMPMATVEPYHLGRTPSPHGKQDETVGLIHEKRIQHGP
jgi:hypothetical protein